MGRDACLRHGRRSDGGEHWFRAGKAARRTVLAEKLQWPTRSDVDAPLVTGAALFGLGWGLVGLCPGPALVNLASFSLPILVFVVAMAVGMIGQDAWRAQRVQVTQRRMTQPRSALTDDRNWPR